MNHNKNWKIIFRGNIYPDFALADVKISLIDTFNIPPEHVEQFFTGASILLKKNLSLEDAQKYQEKLQSMGMMVFIEQETPIFHSMADNGTFKDFTQIASQYASPNNKPAPPQKTKKLSASGAITSVSEFFTHCFTGRYNRLNYINVFCVVTLLTSLNYLIAFTPIVEHILAPIFYIFLMVLLMRACALRLHDLGFTGWLSLLLWVPILNTLFTIILLLMPGNKNSNRYGEPLKKGSIVGLCVFVCLALSLLVSFGTPLYQYYLGR